MASADDQTLAPYGGAANWRHAVAYSHLERCDRTAFAWEWLRRSHAYRQAWRHRDSDSGEPVKASQMFGLERFEDPDLATPAARPVWSSAINPGVIEARVMDPLAEFGDCIDLRILSPFVSIVIDDRQIEHLLLSDGSRSLRIDIVEGTLIGFPASVRFALDGIAGLRSPITTLAKLRRLIERGEFGEHLCPATGRHARWIMELRVADALVSGASHQDIARTLFDGAIAERKWRLQSAAYRQRVQRLVRGARGNLRRPLHTRWFRPVQRLGYRPDPVR